MAVDRVKFQDIVENQFPRYVLEDFPLLPEFVKQYYKSQEYQGGTFDLIQNIDQYVKIDELFSLKSSTTLSGDLDYTATTIPTSALTNFTEGFPETNGLIKIDNEIIHYESISNNSFINCTRGFSGITTYVSVINQTILPLRVQRLMHIVMVQRSKTSILSSFRSFSRR